MRSCIQHHHDCAYIYSGSSGSDMDSIFRHPESPFYKSAVAVPVGSITRAVNQLEKRRIIASIGKRFVFSSPFLRLWLLRNPNM